VTWDWRLVQDELLGEEHPQRHPILTFSGTWAPPGWGYPSDAVRFANDELMYEVPVIAPWSFGPVPPGQINAPSYEESVAIAVEWAVDWITNHTGTFGLVGYSQGGEAASRVLLEIQDGRLTDHAGDFIGGGAFGNPYRQKGKFSGVKNPGGHGIATTNLTSTPKTWAEIANVGDMYACTPDGKAGEIITEFYAMLIQLQLANFGAFCGDMVKSVAGLIPDMLGIATGTETFAAMQAAIVALKFLGTGTAPHIEYHMREIAPGVTGLGYMVQHLNRIASAVPARA
jgi:hypothetical protein